MHSSAQDTTPCVEVIPVKSHNLKQRRHALWYLMLPKNVSVSFHAGWLSYRAKEFATIKPRIIQLQAHTHSTYYRPQASWHERDLFAIAVKAACKNSKDIHNNHDQHRHPHHIFHRSDKRLDQLRKAAMQCSELGTEQACHRSKKPNRRIMRKIRTKRTAVNALLPLEPATIKKPQSKIPIACCNPIRAAVGTAGTSQASRILNTLVCLWPLPPQRSQYSSMGR